MSHIHTHKTAVTAREHREQGLPKSSFIKEERLVMWVSHRLIHGHGKDGDRENWQLWACADERPGHTLTALLHCSCSCLKKDRGRQAASKAHHRFLLCLRYAGTTSSKAKIETDRMEPTSNCCCACASFSPSLPAACLLVSMAVNTRSLACSAMRCSA